MGLIVYLSKTYSGKTHDKKICDEEKLTLPKGVILFEDTGFIGYKPEGVIIKQPTKKPKGKELTPEQKAENQRISTIRVKVEHAISGVKRMRILKDEIRCLGCDVKDLIMLIGCGLHNLRTKARYQTPFVE